MNTEIHEKQRELPFYLLSLRITSITQEHSTQGSGHTAFLRYGALAEAAMTLDFYDLREQPFAAPPDPRFLYMSGPHRQAHAALLQALQAGRSFVLLLAEPGLGKTMLLFHTLSAFGDKVATVYLYQAAQSQGDLLRAILGDLGVREVGETVDGMLGKLEELLTEEQRLGKRVVVVVDEAQKVDPSVFELLSTLSNLVTARGRLVQFILCGQPALLDKLAAIPSMRGGAVARLEPFTAADTAQYLNHRLRTAGYERQAPLFTPEATALVAGFSKGSPRVINSLCTEALSKAYWHKREQIGVDTVREAATALRDLTKPKRQTIAERLVEAPASPAMPMRVAAKAAPVLVKRKEAPPAASASIAPVMVAELPATAEPPVPLPVSGPEQTVVAATAAPVAVAPEKTVVAVSAAPVAVAPEKTVVVVSADPVVVAPVLSLAQPALEPIKEVAEIRVDPSQEATAAEFPQEAVSPQEAFVSTPLVLLPSPPKQATPSRPSRPAILESPARSRRVNDRSLRSSRTVGVGVAAVVLLAVTGAVFGTYRVKTSHAAPLQTISPPQVLLPAAPIARPELAPTVIAMTPKPAPGVPPRDMPSPSRDLKAMDLESALRALSTKAQREQQDQNRSTR